MSGISGYRPSSKSEQMPHLRFAQISRQESNHNKKIFKFFKLWKSKIRQGGNHTKRCPHVHIKEWTTTKNCSRVSKIVAKNGVEAIQMN